jgi:hypothetical protein
MSAARRALALIRSNFARCSPAEGTNAAVEDQVLQRATLADKPTSISGCLKGGVYIKWIIA